MFLKSRTGIGLCGDERVGFEDGASFYDDSSVTVMTESVVCRDVRMIVRVVRGRRQDSSSFTAVG